MIDIRDAALEEAAVFCEQIAAAASGNSIPDMSTEVAMQFAAHEIRKMQNAKAAQPTRNPQDFPVIQMVLNVRCRTVLDNVPEIANELRAVLERIAPMVSMQVLPLVREGLDTISDRLQSAN